MGGELGSRWGSGFNAFLSSYRSLSALGATEEPENLLAGARILLATGTLLAIYIDPIYQVPFARALRIVALAFFVHSLLVLALAWHRPEWVRQCRFHLHLGDLLWLSCISGFIQNANGPVYVFYPSALFILSAAAYRWGLYPTLITGLVYAAFRSIGATVVASGMTREMHLRPSGAEFEDFVRRAAYVAVAGCVIGYLAQKERNSRTKTAVIAQIIGKVHSQATVRDTLEVAMGALLTIFEATEAVLALKEEGKKERVVLWEAKLRPDTQKCMLHWSELDSFQHQRYFFPIPGTSLYGVRRDQSARVDIFALSLEGAPLRKEAYPLPDYFLDWHKSASFLLHSFSLGEESEWSGRLMLFDPKISAAHEAEVRFLQELVREIAPAVYTVYRLRRLRSRASGIERGRIARELHDGVIQTLSALHVRIDFLRQHRAANLDPITADELAQLQQWLRREISNVRDLTHQIRSVDLNSRTLLESVADLVDKFRSDTGITTQLVSESNDIVLPPLVAREILRIIGEALTNVRKHSGARNARVCFGFKDDLLNLVIEDDGRGFDFSGRLNHAELDLARRGPVVIRERVRSIGGELILESAPGRGSRLQISWAARRQEQAV